MHLLGRVRGTGAAVHLLEECRLRADGLIERLLLLLPAGDFAALQRALPNAAFSAAEGLFARSRQIKTPEEIASWQAAHGLGATWGTEEDRADVLAFDITGKGVANPVATFWTGAMMLEHLGETKAAARLMRAVERVTADPALHTPDLGGPATTRQVTDAVLEALRADNL